ncbi:dTDP-4-dehydrorhamnose 3,5-epimerase [Candidatus Pelagibacter sp.]|nr:dTDP-4-dehydrorhamnose 3,5-epimerase [Candidatus Pelagibacter sp.]
MKIKKNKFKDLLIIEGKFHKDYRGYLREIYLEKNINKKFKFQIVSKSKKNILRGLHFQSVNSQGKYLSVIKGKIFDVVVDLRSESKTFGQYFSILLSDKNLKSIYIPEGFAHGFLALENENIISYNCTNYRNAKSELTLKWNDTDINIKWPKINPILSLKDINGLTLKDLIKKNKNF